MPHTYRKTVATMLDRQGLSARTIADQLGHTRVSMTQVVYMGRRAVDQAAAVYWKASHHRDMTMMTRRLPCYRSPSGNYFDRLCDSVTVSAAGERRSGIGIPLSLGSLWAPWFKT